MATNTIYNTAIERLLSDRIKSSKGFFLANQGSNRSDKALLGRLNRKHGKGKPTNPGNPNNRDNS